MSRGLAQVRSKLADAASSITERHSNHRRNRLMLGVVAVNEALEAVLSSVLAATRGFGLELLELVDHVQLRELGIGEIRDIHAHALHELLCCWIKLQQNRGGSI